MQFARHGAKHFLLQSNETRGEDAALLGKRFDFVEDLSVGINEIEAGGENGEDGGRKERVDITADTVVDASHFFISALFGFVVAFEQLGDACGECFLAREQICRGEDADYAGLTLLGGSENVVKITPEFFEGFDEFGMLVGLPGEGIDFLFLFDGVLQIGAETVEIVVNVGDGFGAGAVAEIAQFKANRVDVALHADQEKGIVAVEIDGVSLEATQAVELEEGVGREARYRCEGDEQPQQESECG